MAVSSTPPMMAAAMNRAKAEREAMSSPDPVTRYKAKQRAFDRAFNEMGAALTAQAEKNAETFQQIKENYK